MLKAFHSAQQTTKYKGTDLLIEPSWPLVLNVLIVEPVSLGIFWQEFLYGWGQIVLQHPKLDLKENIIN